MGLFNYRGIVAAERLVWLNSFSNEGCGIARAPFSDACPLEILNTVSFSESGGETTVALRAEPFGEVDAERRYFIDLRPSLEQGYGGTFDQLGGPSAPRLIAHRAHSSHSIGSSDSSQTPRRSQRRPGSPNVDDPLPSTARSNAVLRRRQAHLIGAVRNVAREASAMGCASAGMSITKPISVLSWAERGSKLNEPTNSCASSTENVFACRLEPRAAEAPPRLPPARASTAARFSSKSATPAASRASRRFA